MVKDCVPVVGPGCVLASPQDNQAYKFHRAFGLNLNLQQCLMGCEDVGSAASLETVLMSSPQALSLVFQEQCYL